MTVENIDSIKARAETLLDARREKIVNLQNEIDVNNKNIEAIQEEMNAAADAAALDVWKDAKKRLEDAKDRLEMNEGALMVATTAPLISPEEYEKMRSAIFSEMDANAQAAKEELQRLCIDVSTAANALRDAAGKANTILNVVHVDLYKQQPIEAKKEERTKNAPIDIWADFREENKDKGGYYTAHEPLLRWADKFIDGESGALWEFNPD